MYILVMTVKILNMLQLCVIVISVYVGVVHQWENAMKNRETLKLEPNYFKCQ